MTPEEYWQGWINYCASLDAFLKPAIDGLDKAMPGVELMAKDPAAFSSQFAAQHRTSTEE